MNVQPNPHHQVVISRRLIGAGMIDCEEVECGKTAMSVMGLGKTAGRNRKRQV